jgi:antitoxin VapB
VVPHGSYVDVYPEGIQQSAARQRLDLPADAPLSHAHAGEPNMQTAKLFKNGRSQAVRLPAEFRFEGDEVEIRRDPATGDVILSSLNKSFADWFEEHERLIASMTEKERKELDEFLADRDQGEDVERDWPCEGPAHAGH